MGKRMKVEERVEETGTQMKKSKSVQVSSEELREKDQTWRNSPKRRKNES